MQFILHLDIHFQLFICLWSVVHHHLPQKFILSFRHSFASSKLFNVSLQVYWLFQLDYSWILGPFHPLDFFLLSYKLYTFVWSAVHSFTSTILPYKFHINYTQLFQYIYCLQFPLHTTSFYTACHLTIFTHVFIFYLSKVSMGLIHSNLGSFITTHITLFLLCGTLIYKPTTCTIFFKIPAFIRHIIDPTLFYLLLCLYSH